MNTICRECETVAHCTKHGCIPKVDRTIDMARAIWESGTGIYEGPNIGQLKAFEALVRADERALASFVQEPVGTVKYRLVKIHDALGAHIGDTDPYIPEDMTDEEVCEYEPVFWAAKEIADMIGDAPWDKYTTPPAAQRQWVGLTDEDKLTVRRIPWETLGDLMDNIEAKIKEKNT